MNSGWFHLYEIQITGKFTETENRLEVIRGKVEEVLGSQCLIVFHSPKKYPERLQNFCLGDKKLLGIESDKGCTTLNIMHAFDLYTKN